MSSIWGKPPYTDLPPITQDQIDKALAKQARAKAKRDEICAWVERVFNHQRDSRRTKKDPG